MEAQALLQYLSSTHPTADAATSPLCSGAPSLLSVASSLYVTYLPDFTFARDSCRISPQATSFPCFVPRPGAKKVLTAMFCSTPPCSFLYYYVLFYTPMFCSVLPCSVLYYHDLFYPGLPCSVLPSPFLSYPVPSLVLVCTTMFYSSLGFPFLLCSTLFYNFYAILRSALPSPVFFCHTAIVLSKPLTASSHWSIFPGQ